MIVKSSILARKILKELCKDACISALDYNVFYQHEEIECNELKDIYVEVQGIDIVIGAKMSRGEYIHLLVLEMDDTALETCGISKSGEEVRAAHGSAYEQISMRCKEIASRMLYELRQIGNGFKNVQYAILEAEGALSFSMEELSGCGKYLLPQCSVCTAKSKCLSDGDDVIMDIIMNHRDTAGSYVMPGRVIVYQFEGDEVRAILLKAFERPSLKNGGGRIVSGMYQMVPSYNYTLDTVANDRFVFLFDKEEVVPVEKLDMNVRYMAAELGWDSAGWTVISRMDSGIGKFSVASYHSYADCRRAIEVMVRNGREKVAEVSPFGLEAVEQEKYRRVQLGIAMTDSELADALNLSGLEITGAPRKLAKFMEALAVVTERLNAK